ncbi:divalent metal cation transporter FieF [Idiomarina tyrosinivorans]|uniref:Divalent metal cation transporter FieF n=1 Tax=Idiomarina tyrosinivorans TaxID=1445662 RepID=A0A432ZPU6_9GAMM|nr:cation diffusion facilitator family transporter [Idiomarina tyrosinivorans]RUO79955.1 divalent metal cation transporter FieF [Idiomarina tyrosinivorans]
MSERREHYAFWVKLATRASVLVVFTLIGLKLWAWWVTESASMLASLTDSLLDSGASIFSFFAIRYAIQPADNEHRFGHGKAESLAALAQSAFIAGSSVLLIFHSTEQWLRGDTLPQTDLGIWVSGFAIIITFGLLVIQRLAIRHTNSQAVAADHLHYQSDILLNATVIIALVMAQFGYTWADSAFAIVIALYLIIGASKIGWDAFQALMDRELEQSQLAEIERLAKSVTGVEGMHGLRTRAAGPTRFIQLHIELDDRISLLRAHAIADEVEMELMRAFPGADIIVHMDPMIIAQVENNPSY